MREVVVFVASPGDCDAERDCVRAVSDAVTQSVAPLGVRVRVAGWEHVVPDLGRPQAQINPLVDSCDAFVGILGSYLGSPTGAYSSGFLEEFARVLERRRASERTPRVALYFRNPPAAMLADVGPQLQRVLDFQQRVREEKLALYATFAASSDLEGKLWELFLTLAIEAVAPGKEVEEASVSAAESTVQVLAPASDDIDEARLQIAATTDAVTRYARGLPTEVRIDSDRLLLIALGLNDDGEGVPVHVANRLYLRGDELALSLMEAKTWLRTVLGDIGRRQTPAGRSIPGWGVLPGLFDKELSDLLRSDDDAVLVGTFRTLQRLGARPSPLWMDSAEGAADVVRTWAVALGRPGVFDAALEYLAAMAGNDDLPMLDAIRGQHDAPSIRELGAILAGDPNALALTVADSYSPPAWKIAMLAEAMGRAGDESVRALASSAKAPADTRVQAFNELLRRKKIDDDVLMVALANDSLAEEVFAAVKVAEPVVSAAAVAAAIARMPKDTPRWSDLSDRARSATSTVAELLSQIDPSGFSLDVWEALGWTGDPSLVEKARIVFDTDGEEFVAPLADNELWKSQGHLFPFLRSQARLAALRILVAQTPVADEDRGRVRAEITRGADLSREATVMLTRVAAAEDVPFLLEGLPNTYGADRAAAVERVIRTGGTESARILAQSTNDDDALKAVVALGFDQEVGVEELRRLLYMPRAAVRVEALKQVVARLSESEWSKLLSTYVGEHPYYYNVVVELDWLMYAARVRGVAGEFAPPDQNPGV